MQSPLAEPGSPDITAVREHTEGEYSDSGYRVYGNAARDLRPGEHLHPPRRGEDNPLRLLEEARGRGWLLVGATKPNGISITMPFFDEIFHEIVALYPDVEGP